MLLRVTFFYKKEFEKSRERKMKEEIKIGRLKLLEKSGKTLQPKSTVKKDDFDIIYTWVNGSDPVHRKIMQEEKAKFFPGQSTIFIRRLFVNLLF